MTKPKTLYDSYLDAVRLLARADEHLQLYASEHEDNNRLSELIENLRSDISNFLKRKYPS